MTYPTTGLTFKPCRDCRTPIAFTKTDKGKLMPVERDGTPHWGSCTNAKRFRKGKE